MKILLIGGSFRLGGQGNMSIGDPRSYSEQKDACMSHLAYCKHIENKFGSKPSIFINTYDSPFVNEMIQWYSAYYHVTHVVHKIMIGYDGLVSDTVKRLDEEDDVIFIRIDLLLKPAFFDVVLGDRLSFSSVCFTLNNWHIHNGFPRVADLILFIPRRLFHLISEQKVSLGHHSYEHFINQGLGKDDIGFLLNTYHDSDSAKDWNPIYKIVNRPETAQWYDRGKTIDY